MRKLYWISFVALLSGAVSAQQQSFQVSNTTPDCRTGNRAIHEVCLPEGQRVAAAPVITTISEAGSSSIESSGPAPGKPNCWQITTVVQPNGEECLRVPFAGQICNCKGRGWINLDVQLTPAQ